MAWTQERYREWSRERYRKIMADPVKREAYMLRKIQWNAWRREHRRNNRAQENAEIGRHRELHRDKYNSYMRQWRKKNPLAAATNDCNKRTKRRGALGKHTAKQWLARVCYFGNRCIYCKAELKPETISKEHIKPIARGGSNWASNLAPACRTCNCTKRHKTVAEFAVYIAKKKSKFARLNEIAQ